MNKKAKSDIFTLQGFYFCIFFGLGAITPLLSVYLSNVEGLNGFEIGMIMSMGPIITIFFQPLWGMLSDYTNAPVKLLTITTLLSGVFGLGYVVFEGYSWFLVIAILVAIFQSAIIPISDSLSLSHATKVGYNYGNIRMFGSLGFGIAVFVLGRISDSQPASIFYSYFLFFAFAAILAIRIPKEKTTASNKNLLKGLKEILTFKKYLIFMGITFLIFGPNLANNTYFGLFIGDRGGTYTGIGIAFLIAVLSEVPFMRVADRLVRRFGILEVAMLAGIVSLLRWILYFFEPNLMLVYISSVIQGFSIGLFIPVGLQYLRVIIPPHIVVTGITLYSAIGNGLGNWFSTFIGGVIYEHFSIYSVYLFFALLAAIGIILNVWLIKEERKTEWVHSTAIK